jgi:hypothetical protein
MNNIVFDDLDNKTKTFTLAINSLIEELEAIDYYNQRASIVNKKNLKDLIIHNRNEEIEHAAMLIEFLRRINPVFNAKLHTYMFTEDPITEVEEESTESDDDDSDDEE